MRLCGLPLIYLIIDYRGSNRPLDGESTAPRSQRADLNTEMAEDEALHAGQRTLLDLTSFAELPRRLIQRRIGNDEREAFANQVVAIEAWQAELAFCRSTPVDGKITCSPIETLNRAGSRPVSTARVLFDCRFVVNAITLESARRGASAFSR